MPIDDGAGSERAGSERAGSERASSAMPAGSRWASLAGPVHYVDHGGPADGPLLVCVHGLGGSHANWSAIAPLLTPTCRVVALDLAGFGHTRGGSRSTGVDANRRLLGRFLEEVSGTPVILVGNSMGGLIAILQAADSPATVAGLVLIDPALPVGVRARPDPVVAATFAALSIPAVGRSLLSRRRSRQSAEDAAMDLLRLCCVDPARVPRPVVDEHVDLARQRRAYPDADAELMAAARSLVWVLADRRAYAARQRSIVAPVLLLQGERDRLVPVQAARAAAAANPSWEYHEAADVGHVPQLEAPEWTAGHILAWIAAHPQTAQDAARARGVQSAGR
jgi:pimeloyl-ACP methyl ester carboxylesterase